MGSVWTRILDEILNSSRNEEEIAERIPHPVTPIPTARRFVLGVDPRSPIQEGIRTPIVIECSANKTENDDLPPEKRLNFMETDFETDTTTRVRFIPEDPRSPTLGISRTPIQVLSTPEQAEALKNVLRENNHNLEELNDPSKEEEKEKEITFNTPLKHMDTDKNVKVPFDKLKGSRLRLVKSLNNKINEDKENSQEIKKKEKEDVSASPRTPLSTMQPGAILRIKQMRDIKAAVGASDSITNWDRDASVLI